MTVGGRYDDSPGRLRRAIVHDVLAPFRIELIAVISDKSRLVAGVLPKLLRTA
jgi:hypothetical protein